MKEKPQGAGGTSFQLVDVGKVVGELCLKKGDTFLDMACGQGDYAIEFSTILGEEGFIYALDLWEENIVQLRERISASGIKNIEAVVADVSKETPIGANSVDVCLLATVLHDLKVEKVADQAVNEAARVIKPNGLLAVIEFKKIDGPPGPPKKIRLGPEEVAGIVTPHGFVKKRTRDVGAYNYLMTFVLKDHC